MIKFNYFLLLAFSFITISLTAQNSKYYRVKLNANNLEIKELLKSGISFDNTTKSKDNSYVIEVSDKELQIIKQKNIKFEIKIDDLSKYYSDRYKKSATKNNNLLSGIKYTTPEHFNYGSMGGFLTLDEIYAELDEMRSLYPELITEKAEVSTIHTIEDRPVYFVKIGKNIPAKDAKPEILYTSLTHAREPAAMQALVWYMWYLLENYESDAEIKYLVDNIDMFFIPIVNPDGYEYNRTTNPNGGGMWRKNKRDNNNNGSFSESDDGVDLNRNFGFQWGYDDDGSSPDPSDNTYRGASAFSEPETQILKEFCESHNFLLAHNHHTYSDLIIIPWGYDEIHTPDDNILRTYANTMASENGYTVGQGWEILYTVNGDSNDWMYGEQVTKPKIFAFTQETGSSADGFWPEQDRIIPLCEESYMSNLYLARYATEYAKLNDISENYVKKTGYLKFNLQRLGLAGTGDYTVTITPDANTFSNVINPINIASLGVLETKTDSFQYTLSDNINYGSDFSYEVTVSAGEYYISKTFTKTYIETNTVFQDSCNTLENWTSNKWTNTNSTYYSADYSITDSETGNYNNNENSNVTMINSIDLNGVNNPKLSFWAKWAIETDWDYTQLLISTNDGASWTPVETNHTNAGTGSFQPVGEPLFDGSSSWVKNEVDLSGYANNSIKFRFEINSDGYVTADGLYFDDFTIFGLNMSPTKTDNTIMNEVHLYPNPARNSFNVYVNKELASGKVEIINTTGKTVKLIRNISQVNNIDCSDISKGVYFVKITSDKKVYTHKIIVSH